MRLNHHDRRCDSNGPDGDWNDPDRLGPGGGGEGPDGGGESGDGRAEGGPCLSCIPGLGPLFPPDEDGPEEPDTEDTDDDRPPEWKLRDFLPEVPDWDDLPDWDDVPDSIRREVDPVLDIPEDMLEDLRERLDLGDDGEGGEESEDDGNDATTPFDPDDTLNENLERCYSQRNARLRRTCMDYVQVAHVARDNHDSWRRFCESTYPGSSSEVLRARHMCYGVIPSTRQGFLSYCEAFR